MRADRTNDDRKVAVLKHIRHKAGFQSDIDQPVARHLIGDGNLEARHRAQQLAERVAVKPEDIGGLVQHRSRPVRHQTVDLGQGGARFGIVGGKNDGDVMLRERIGQR